MKKVFVSLLLAFSIISFAQDSIPRVPIVEVFTSSTCGPCTPGNVGIKKAYIDDASMAQRYTMIKYQMSWPGLGDPYYTVEGRNRRNFYGVNGVPHLYINGDVHFQPVAATTKNELEAEMKRFSYLKITPHIKTSNGGKTIDIDVAFEPLQTIKNQVSKIFVAIVETNTVKNAKSNGETSFEMVFKKMLPTNGELIQGDMLKGVTFNFKTCYTFNGNYRLPNSSIDPIDHATEHSIENFNNLKVVVWLQDLPTKEIFNSAWGYDKADTTHPNHPFNPKNPLGEVFGGSIDSTTSTNESGLNIQKELIVFPNPSNGTMHVEIPKEVKTATIEIIDMKGVQVSSELFDSQNSEYLIPLTISTTGLYLIRVKGDGITLTKKVLVE